MIKQWMVVVVLISLSACARSGPWRTGDIDAEDISAINVQNYSDFDFQNQDKECSPSEPCASALVEVFADTEDNIGFELGFVEFSERGNLFNDARANFVLNRINEYASDERGLLTVVFVHGWKNNASTANGNVEEFRKVLHGIASKQRAGMVDNRRIMGLYVGWRGLSLDLPLLDQLTFWERKAVAEQIGENGASDLFLTLEELDAKNDKNILVVIGHSFGGAITLTAFNEVILDRLHVQLQSQQPLNRPVADAMVLLNPAIEANEILHIKEQLVRHQTDWQRIASPNLLRVVSTTADQATHLAFPVGQTLGVNLAWQQAQLSRDYLDGSPLRDYFKEEKLDTTTAGNFLPFHTQELKFHPDRSNDRWQFSELCQGESRILDKTKKDNVAILPCSDADPVQFLYTSPEFMSGHSDVFNKQVSAYIAGVIHQTHIEAMRRMQRLSSETIGSMPTSCGEKFDFRDCVRAQYQINTDIGHE